MAVTDLAADIVASHVFAFGVQSPVQATVSVPLGVAVSVTTVPWLNVALQVPVVQPAIPAGLDDTDPLPVPAIVSDSWKVGTKVAVTDRA